MTKNELKLALTEAGIEFKAKAKLEDLQALFDALPAQNTPAVVEDDGFTMSEEELAAQTLRNPPVEGLAMVNGVLTDQCPGCGIHLSNGLLTPDDEVANKPDITLHMEGMNHAYECMGCGHQFGEERAPYVAPAKPEPTGNGLKIEKDRPEQNGIKRPSIGGKCRAIWDALDEYRAETGELPTSKTVKELAADSGWNPNNASIEFYQWRKYHGIGKQA